LRVKHFPPRGKGRTCKRTAYPAPRLTPHYSSGIIKPEMPYFFRKGLTHEEPRLEQSLLSAAAIETSRAFVGWSSEITHLIAKGRRVILQVGLCRNLHRNGDEGVDVGDGELFFLRIAIDSLRLRAGGHSELCFGLGNVLVGAWWRGRITPHSQLRQFRRGSFGGLVLDKAAPVIGQSCKRVVVGCWLTTRSQRSWHCRRRPRRCTWRCRGGWCLVGAKRRWAWWG
jgi:hypothetical protein